MLDTLRDIRYSQIQLTKNLHYQHLSICVLDYLASVCTCVSISHWCELASLALLAFQAVYFDAINAEIENPLTYSFDRDDFISEKCYLRSV